MATRILIPSGAGSPGFGGIVACLREIPDSEIIAGDIEKLAYGRFLADGFVSLPAGDSQDYIPRLLEAIEKYKPHVILPVTTRELQALSRSIDIIRQAGAAISITPPHRLAQVNNKSILYNELRNIQYRHAEFAVVHSKEELIAAARKLGAPEIPVIMKPSEGNGSRGFRIITSKNMMRSLYFSSKSGSLYTCLEAAEQEMPDVLPGSMLVCEYLPGTEWSTDLIAENGKVLVQATRVREKTVSGISTRGFFEYVPDIEKQVTELCMHFELHGPIGMQFRARANGEPVLLEINPRLQGAVSTARFAGINFPAIAVDLSMNRALQKYPEPQYGVHFARFWQDAGELNKT